MATRKLTNRTEIEDFVQGLAFCGTGGGGTAAGPIADQLVSEHEAGATIGWTDIRELPDDAWTFSVAGLGGQVRLDSPDSSLLSRIGLANRVYTEPFAMLLAASKTLIELYGVTPGAVVPVELGSSNTVTPLLVANELGIPLIDGDYCGRAKPEIQQSILEIEQHVVSPLVFVDEWGDVIHLPQTASAGMADRIGRHLCTASLGRVAVARTLLPAAKARTALVQNSLETALSIGRHLREARQSSRSPAKAIADYLGGAHVFDGRLDEIEFDPLSGLQFHICTYHFSGVGAFESRNCSVWTKNEHHLVWLDGSVRALSPDLIAIIDRERGVPLTRHEMEPGTQVSIVAVPPLDSRWRSRRGIELLGPTAFGFDIAYRPLETLVD